MLCKLTIILLYNFDYMTMISKNYRKQMDKIKTSGTQEKNANKTLVVRRIGNIKISNWTSSNEKLANQGMHKYGKKNSNKVDIK